MCDPAQELGNLWEGIEDIGGEIMGGIESIAETIADQALPIIMTVALTYALGPAGYGLSTTMAGTIASAATSALNGGSMEQIILSAATSWAGGQIGEFAGSSIDMPHVDSTGAIYTSTGLSVDNQLLLKQIVTSASSSAATTALQGRPLDEVLASAASVAVGSLVRDQLTQQGVDPKTISGAAISNTANAVTRAILNNTSVSDALGGAFASTAISAALGQIGASDKFKNTFKDLSPQVSEANQEFETARSSYLDNINKQNAVIEDYNTKIKPLQEVAAQIKDLHSQYKPLEENYNNYDAFMKQNGYLFGFEADDLGNPSGYYKPGAVIGKQLSYDQEGNPVWVDARAPAELPPASMSKDAILNQANALARQINSLTPGYEDLKTKLLGGEVTKTRTETRVEMQVLPREVSGNDGEGWYSTIIYENVPVEVPVQVQYKETVVGSLESVKKEIDNLKTAATGLENNLKQKQEGLTTTVGLFTQAELDNAQIVANEIKNYATASKQYKDEFGVDPTEDQLKSFGANGDIIGTVTKLVADNNNEQFAKEAGFKNYADYTAAGNVSPNEYYAKQQGWQDYAQQLNAQNNGYTEPAAWNTYIDNQQTAVDNGFVNYQDYQSAGDQTANDYYAKKEGWTDYAQKQQAEDSGFQTPTTWTAKLNQDKAESRGFKNYEDYVAAGWDKKSGGWGAAHFGTWANDFYAQQEGWQSAAQKQQAGDAGFDKPTDWKNHEGAKAAGFPDYETARQYKGNIDAYTTDQNNAAAVKAGFPSYDIQQQYKDNLGEYQAQQEGWNSYFDKLNAQRYDINSPLKYEEFLSGKTEEQRAIEMLKERGLSTHPDRVKSLTDAWNFDPSQPSVGFTEALNKSDVLRISNDKADTVQEAAALAQARGFSSFRFGGDQYQINTQSAGANPYDFFSTFDEAFKAARKDLGDGQVFSWTDPQTGKTGYFTTNLSGEKVTDGGFNDDVRFSAKSRLVENLQDMKINPADLNAKDMEKFVDQFANATPAQRAALLNGSYSSTFKVINEALTTQKTVLDSTAEAIKSGKLDLSKPIEGTGTIRNSDVTNYKQILASVGNNVATDLASTSLSVANMVGSALGLDTADIERVQKLMTTDKNKQMDKLVGMEKNAAAGFTSAIETGFAYALGGAPGAIGTLTAFAANNAWLEGKEAGLSNQDNAIRTAAMASFEAVGEALGIPGLNRLMKGVPMTGSPTEIVNAVKNFGLAMGNEQVAELLTTTAQFAFDKWSQFGIGKNATVQDYSDALKDTVLTTAFAVGGSATIGQATRSLQSASTAPTTQLWSQNLPDEIWNRIKDSGVSQSEIDSLKSGLRNSFGSNNYTVQQAQENFESRLASAGFTQQEIDRIAEPAAVDVIADKVKTSFESAGVPAAYVDSLADLTATQIYNNEGLPTVLGNVSEALQTNGMSALDANLIANQALTGTDVRKAVTEQLTAQGYNPSAEEVNTLVSQNATAGLDAITTAVGSYVDPLSVSKEEAKAALLSVGISNPTDAQINLLAGQYDQNLLQQKAAQTVQTPTVTAPTVTTPTATTPTVTTPAGTDTVTTPAVTTPTVTTPTGTDTVTNPAATTPTVTTPTVTTPAVTTPTVTTPTVTDTVTAPTVTTPVVTTPAATDAGAGTGTNTSAGTDTATGPAVTNPNTVVTDTGGVTNTGAGTSANTGAGTDTAVTNTGGSQAAGNQTGAGTDAVTNASVTTAINNAIAGIQFPAGISKADVAAEIKAAMDANPGLKATDVSQAIAAYMQANPAVTSSEVSTAINNATNNLVTQTALNSALNTAAQETKTQFDALTKSQQEIVSNAVTQGRTLTDAINDVQSSVTTQVTDLQKQIDTRINELLLQGKTLQEANDLAISEVGQQTKGVADELKKIKDAQKASADQSQRQSLLNMGMGLIGGAAAAGAIAEEPRKEITPLGGKGPAGKFSGPLEEFLKMVEHEDYTGTPQQQAGRNMPITSMQDRISDVAAPPENSYFSYGQPTDIDSFLSSYGQDIPLTSQTDNFTLGAKRGGLMSTPLMANGGTHYGKNSRGALSLVHHSGKARVDFREGAAVSGEGDGQSDDIPAMLADGEFVFPADVVAAIGNGSTKAGSDKLYDMMHGIRAHVRSAKPQDLPPEIKSPLDFLKSRKARG